MTHIIAALIWGVVSATMICKTSGSPFDNYYRSPWTD